MASPVYDQDAFRGRNDDVALNSTTFNGGGGLNGNWTQDVDTTFRVRFVIQQTNAAKTVNNQVFDVRYEKNATGGYQEITTASSNIILVNDGNSIADHATTTQVIGGGTYSTGDSEGWNDGQTDNDTGNCDFNGAEEVELEFCLQIVSGDVADGDSFTLHVYLADGTALDSHTNTPTITANEGVATSDSQSAYLKGKDTASDNQAAYLAGSLDTSDSQAAYLDAVAGATANQSAFLQGQDTASDNQAAYLAGSLDASDNQAAFLQGQTTASDSQAAYLEGASAGGSASDRKSAYLAGSLNVADSQPAYMNADPVTSVIDIQGNEGRIRSGTLQNDYARAIGNATDTQDVELLVRFQFNESDAGGTLRFFIRGSRDWNDFQTPTKAYEVAFASAGNYTINRIESGSRTQIGTDTWGPSTSAYWIRFQAQGTQIRTRVWLDGGAEPGTWDQDINDSASGFTTPGTVQLGIFTTSLGAPSHTVYLEDLAYQSPTGGTSDSQPAYLKGQDVASDSQAAYLAGSLDTSDNQAAYLAGSLDASDNQAAYLAGTDTASANQAAYLAGSLDVSDSQPAYLEGASGATGNQSAYIHGQDNALDNQSAYLAGADTASDNQPAYLEGASGATGNQSAYIHGQDSALDNQSAYTHGQDDASDSQAAYIHGGVEVSDSGPAFLAGEAAASDSQPAYIAGELTASDSQPAYLAGSEQASDSQSAYLEGGAPASAASETLFKGMWRGMWRHQIPRGR